MVVEGVACDPVVELLRVVHPLRAEVVDPVVVFVLLVQVLPNVVEAVTVDGLEVLGREAHGDDAPVIADVGQVEVVLALPDPEFFLANDFSDSVRHFPYNFAAGITRGTVRTWFRL